jgi:uncharacterized repeat protein (TIGR01451 family)
MTSRHWLGTLVLTAAACGNPPADPPVPTSSTAQPVWANGDFEGDAIDTMPPTGWTVTANLNPGVTDTRPGVQTLASLNLASGGSQGTVVVGGSSPESQTDPDVGASGTLRYPKYGTRAVAVNRSASVTGTGRNSNTLRQTMTISEGDVDPVDNKVHVRFAVAPVLQNPGHSYSSQPYYFVRLHNITKGITVYSDFNASGQPGVPWKNFTDSTGQAAQYTDWQLVDVSPGSSQLAIGDQVELMVVASGCSASGHWGRVYVDSVGSGVPGLYTWGTGPQQANAGTQVTYTLYYKNGGTTTAAGSTLDFVTPPSTTYQAHAGATCTAPAAGATGTVSCALGTLAPGSTGSFTVTVEIPAATADGTVITNGNYSIYATGVSALVGPKVQTTVTSGVSYADVGVTKTDGAAALAWGQATTYTLVASNAGPLATTATVTDPMPAQLTGATWTCVAAGGATCTASGSGDLSDAISLPVGGTATYTVSASVIAGSGSGQVVNTAAIATTDGLTDPDSSNNTAVDTNAVGTLSTLTVSRALNAAAGSVTSVPAAIQCGGTCSGDFLDGSQVVLTAAPVAGATFAGWGGACSGTAATCTLTIAGAQAVTAAFVGAPAAIAATGGAAQSAATSTAFPLPLSVAVTDAAGYGVPGVTVAFAGPGSGARATLSAATAVTSSSGAAFVTATANATAGTYAITASTSGVSPPATFTLTNLGVPATIAVSSGSGQSTTVGTAFSSDLVAVVLDAANNPVSGATVTFARPASGASITGPSSATTDASGLARIAATATTTAGAFQVSASVPGVGSSASFSLTNTAGAPAALAVISGAGQSTTVATAFGQSLGFLVSDAHGNPVPGAAIALAAPASGATAALTSASLTTASDGTASTTATAGTVAGSYSVSASTAGASSVTVGLTQTAGAAATLAVTGGGTQSATVATAFGAALAVVVRDAYGNPRSGASVSFAAPATGATAQLAASAATSNASGIASVAATAGTVAGGYSVSASLGALAPATFALTNTAGAPATVTATGGGAQSAVVATAFAAQLAVDVTDAFGNAVPGASVTFEAPATGAAATFAPAVATTDALGQATTTATASTTAGAYTATARAGAAPAASFALTNEPGAPASLEVAGGSAQSQVVTRAFGSPLAVIVRDAFGNAVPGIEVAFTAPPSGASAALSAAAVTSDASGRVEVAATANAIAGPYQVLALIGEIFAALDLTNLADEGIELALVSGDGQAAEVAAAFGAPLVAIVRDLHGNPVPGQRVELAAPMSGASATLAASALLTDATGQVRVGAVANHVAGSYAIAATTARAARVQFQLTNQPGDPVSIAMAAASTPQAAKVGDGFQRPIAVRVSDRFGNGVPGAAVTVAAPGAGPSASLSSLALTTDAAGDAEAHAIAGAVAGAYAVTATIPTGAMATAALTNTADVPASLTIVAGDAQSTQVASELAGPLAVLVRDAFGNPVPRAAVTFAAPATGAAATPSASTVATGMDGIASVTARANHIAGRYALAATATGAAAPVAFSLENTPGPAAAITAELAATPQAAQVATGFARPLVARVTDAFGNPVPGVVVSYTAPADGATGTLTESSSTTNASGLCHVSATAGTSTGGYHVTAAIAGAQATFELTNLAGPPTTLTAAGGGAQETPVDTAFGSAMAVLVSDALGNPVPNATVTFTLPASGPSGEASERTVQTAADGVASVLVRAGTLAGRYHLVATAADGAAGVAFPLTNLPDTAASVAMASATAQSTQVDHAFGQPLTVRVTDRFGNAVSGALVEYAAPAEDATAALSAPALATDAAGEAQVLAVASAVAGTYPVTASASGALTAATFTLTNTAGPASRVLAAAGMGQRALATSPFAAPVRVQLVDGHGNPVPGAAVTPVLPTAGATVQLAAPALPTDAAGMTELSLIAGPVVGEVALQVGAPGLLATVRVALTIDPIPTAVTAAATDVTVDEPVAVRATVSGELGTPTGEVEVVDEQGAVLARGALVDGAAEVLVTLRRVGATTLAVRYPAQGSYAASRSTSVAVHAGEDAGSLSGGSCQAGGGAGGGLMILLALAAVLRARRRAPRAVGPAALVGAAIALAAAPAAAQEAGARAIDRLHAAAADSAWFGADSVGFAGDEVVAVSALTGYAHRPLVAYDADGSARGVVVRHAVVTQAGASIALRDRVRLSATAPLAVYQSGASVPFNGMPMASPTFAFGDVRLAGDVRVAGRAGGALRVAAGLRATLPSGSRTNYMSDGVLGLEPRVQAAGSAGVLEYAAGASAYLRETTTLAGLRFGHELRFSAALGMRLARGRLLVGSELLGTTPLASGTDTGTPMELGVGAHYEVGPSWQLGVGASMGLLNAVGAPDERVVLSLGWRP